MRFLKVVAVLSLCFMALSLLATASQNKFGIADNRTITFNDPIWVGDKLLPKGEYQVSHVMEGNQHIMIFKQLNNSRPAEVRVPCQLVQLQKKADRTERSYVLNAANERVLKSLIFQGDSAQHVF
jgi:hypothetical protein